MEPVPERKKRDDVYRIEFGKYEPSEVAAGQKEARPQEQLRITMANFKVVNRLFSGKTDLIKRQCEYFWSHETALADVNAYQNGTPNYDYAEHTKWIKAKTCFTNWEDHSFAKSENALIIGNRSSFDVVQYPDNPERAGMSMIHLLAIPKARLFNGVSLNADNVSIIDEMISLFKSSWADPIFRRTVLMQQWFTIGQQNEARPDMQAYKTAMKHYGELSDKINQLTVDDFTFGLHLWPDNSVGHLHLHILATPDWCRQYSTFAHDEKTKDAIEVRDYILNSSEA
ncbi:hypothetical protein F5Y13DRAFT_191622 [Hypoxylon sp. FL1857]|nr:hypothetical protein F5Y13DRAFT_191622 [Hypoxylon sp. FL1857]